jgi:6-phosphogluconolactonase (cycloisomerase 2 family)
MTEVTESTEVTEIQETPLRDIDEPFDIPEGYTHRLSLGAYHFVTKEDQLYIVGRLIKNISTMGIEPASIVPLSKEKFDQIQATPHGKVFRMTEDCIFVIIWNDANYYFSNLNIALSMLGSIVKFKSDAIKHDALLDAIKENL